MADPAACPRHPGTSTRLSCSRCDAPVCGACVVPTDVGQRCPDCAGGRPGPRAGRAGRRRGPPAVRGTAVALLGGGLLGLVLTEVTFGGIILSALLGHGVGAAVARDAEASGSQGAAGSAVVLAVAAVGLAMLVGSGLTSVVAGSPLQVLAYPLAGYLAHQRASR